MSYQLYKTCYKVCPHSYLGSVSCVSVNVDGFTSPSFSSAINRSHGVEGFAAVSVGLSAHTGKQSPESLQHEP
jgi:hypothetical protein